MRNGIRAGVLGAAVGVTIVVGSGAAFADAPVYPPVAPPTPVTQVLGITIVAQPAPAAPVVAAVAVAKPQASLPFTGLDTMALVGVGSVLVVGGAALALASRKRRSDSL